MVIDRACYPPNVRRNVPPNARRAAPETPAEMWNAAAVAANRENLRPASDPAHRYYHTTGPTEERNGYYRPTEMNKHHNEKTHTPPNIHMEFRKTLEDAKEEGTLVVVVL